MPRPLGHVRILLSSRVIFDLEEADRIFAEKGQKEYADYMRGRDAYENDFNAKLGGRKLNPGPMWNFVQAALRLNEISENSVEIAMLCKDTAETALPIFRNLDVANMSLPMRLVTSGGELTKEHLQAFGVDLFLSRNTKDVQLATDLGLAAAVINFPPDAKYKRHGNEALHLCVDGDAVTFGSSAEVVYQKQGLDKYRKNEFNKFATKIEPGPFTQVLAKISQLNAQFPKDQAPFKLSLLTARGNEAAARVLTAAEKFNIEFNNGLIFASGASKSDILREFKPDIFFDDQQAHLKDTSLFCPAGQVLYPSGSPMHQFLAKKAAAAAKQEGPKQ